MCERAHVKIQLRVPLKLYMFFFEIHTWSERAHVKCTSGATGIINMCVVKIACCASGLAYNLPHVQLDLHSGIVKVDLLCDWAHVKCTSGVPGITNMFVVNVVL